MNDSKILSLHEDIKVENDDAVGGEDSNLLNWDIEEEKYDIEEEDDDALGAKDLNLLKFTEQNSSETNCAAITGRKSYCKKKIITVLF